jgi:hypothetical protein
VAKTPMFTWLTEPQITDMVQSKSKLKKNTDVPKVSVYLVHQNVLLVLLPLKLVLLVPLEESMLQIVFAQMVNTLTLTSCVNLVIQNVKLVLIMKSVLNVLKTLSEKPQKIVNVLRDITMLTLLSVHNVIIIVLNVNNIQNVQFVMSTENRSHIVHVFSICSIMPEFVMTVKSGVMVVLITQLIVTTVHLNLTESLIQSVTVNKVTLKSMKKNVQNVNVNVLPVLEMLPLVRHVLLSEFLILLVDVKMVLMKISLSLHLVLM